MAVILFTNLKGGVAKTTNAVAVAECLASQGKRTLVIDADHQCTASELLLGEVRMLKADQQKMTTHDLMMALMDPDFLSSQLPSFVSTNSSNISDGLPDLSTIPCSIRIDDFQRSYAKGGHGFKSREDLTKLFRKNKAKLRKWLVSEFDFTIIDCPPSLAIQVHHLLQVADAYVVPCQPNRLSVRGGVWLQDRIRRTGCKIMPLGTLWSMCRGNDRRHQQIIDLTKQRSGHYAKLPAAFETTIPLTTSIAHAIESDRERPGSFHQKYGTASRVFEALSEEIMGRFSQLENDQHVSV